jgi:DNA-binding MarR family transcriptional regulator
VTIASSPPSTSTPASSPEASRPSASRPPVQAPNAIAASAVPITAVLVCSDSPTYGATRRSPTISSTSTAAAARKTTASATRTGSGGNCWSLQSVVCIIFLVDLLGRPSPPPEPSMTAVRPPDPDLGALGHELFRQARILHMLKARLTAESTGLDSGALGVLVHVVKSGGMRQRDLADCAMLDPSTVSRYVGLLAKVGYVERQADQGDGRAVRLVATDAGRAVHARLTARRESMMSEVLAGWSAEDVDELTTRLRRLNDDLEAIRSQPGLHPFRHPPLTDAGAPTGPDPAGHAGSTTLTTHDLER